MSEHSDSFGEDLCWDTLDHLAALVRVWTPQDGCLYVNGAWCDLTGQTQEQSKGSGWLDPVHVDDRPALVDALAAALEARRGAVADYRLSPREGGPLYVRDWAQPWLEDDGHVLGFVHTCLPRHLVQDSFGTEDSTLRTWAHELRGPLNAILGWADLLAAGGHPPDIVARGLKAIAANARQQAAILRRMSQSEDPRHAGGG